LNFARPPVSLSQYCGKLGKQNDWEFSNLVLIRDFPPWLSSLKILNFYTANQYPRAMCYHVSSSLGDEKLKSLLKKKSILNADKYVPGYHFHGFSKPYLPVVSILNPDTLDFYR
jgi:hypothetical protein